MNNEIKEILDRLDYNEWEVDLYKVPITWCELYDIRDYITNLQQENERLKKELNNKEFVFVGTAQNKTRDFIKNLVKEKNDYKSRCEKAIDKLTIKQARFINEKDYILDDNDLDEIMYILQNGSENQ